MTLVSKIRTIISVAWIVFVCVCYAFNYFHYLQKAYPVLKQVDELGILGLLKRFIIPS